MYLTYLVLLGLAILCNSILLITLYKRTQKNTITISLLILLILVNIWFFPKFLTNAFHISGVQFETLSRIAAFGYIFVPVVLVVFSVAYSSFYKLLTKLYFWTLLLIPPIALLYLSWTSDLIGVHDYSKARLFPWGYETPAGPYWLQYMLWYDLLILFALGTLIYNYKTMIDVSRKKQTLFIIIAIVVPLVFNTIAVGILPIFGIFVFPVGLILLNILTFAGITLVYHNGWLEVSPTIILSNMAQIVLTVDMGGYVIHANSFAEKSLKTKSGRIIGRPLSDILYINHKEKANSNHCNQLLQLVLSRGKSMTFNTFSAYLNRSNKKQKLTGIISISPIYTNSAIVGANIFLRDTRKEELLEKQRNDYFNVLFHELKTPLTSVKAYNQILLSKLKESSNENINIALRTEKQLNKLIRLINDFYELSRAHSGKLMLKKEYLDINTLVQNVVETTRIIHKNRNIYLQGYSNYIVYADKVKIEQILINFINNAIKYSPANKDITIFLTSNTKNVTIGVQDFGRGVDPKYHKRIFDRFFQVANSPKEKKGLGIGLFIASMIVKAHGGRIWLNSKIGKGSTFYFSLPARNP